MELQQLAYLRAVVQQGSVTRAADSMDVAQPSISKAIRALERELGTPLFHRAGRRLAPTEAGTLLAECAARIFDDLTATGLMMSEVAQSARGSLRVCATETVMDELLPPATSALRRARPNVHISIEMTGTDEAIQRVLGDAVDLAIVPLPLADSRLDIAEIGAEPVVLVVPSTDPFAQLISVSLADALRRPDILLSMPGHGLRAQVEQAAQRLGVTLESGVQIRSQRALLQMVACGAGVTFAPWISARAAVGDVAICALTPALTRHIGWIARRGRHIPPVARLLVEHVTDALRRAVG